MSLFSKIQRCEQKTGDKSCQQKAGKGKYKKGQSRKTMRDKPGTEGTHEDGGTAWRAQKMREKQQLTADEPTNSEVTMQGLNTN